MLSPVAEHLLSTDHNADLITIELLHESTKGRLINKLGEVEVVSARQ